MEELPKPIALNESPRDYEDSLPEEFNPIFDYESSSSKQVSRIPALNTFNSLAKPALKLKVIGLLIVIFRHVLIIDFTIQDITVCLRASKC